VLDNNILRQLLDKHAPGVDVAGDGIYSMEWRSTETVYRFTEEYVPVTSRGAYKFDLEQAFPGKKDV